VHALRQGFEPQRDVVLTPTKHVGQYLATVIIDRMSQPSWVRLLAHITPHFIELGLQPTTEGKLVSAICLDLHLLGMSVRQYCVIHLVQRRCLFLSSLHDRMGADMQHARRIAHPTGVHGHVDDLALHLRRLPHIGVVQQERATCTALLSATVPLLALTDLAMADHIRAVTVGTVEDLEDHDATQSYWGY